jgi:transposase
MTLVNRYCKCSKLSEVKFRYLLRLFALDLTASDAARLTGLSVRAVNDTYLRLRRRLHQLCPVPVELGGALELDEPHFGPRRVRGKRGRERGAKRLSSACSNAGARCTPRLCRTARKRPCRALFGVKSTRLPWSIPMAGAATMAWWMGAFDRHYRVLHRHDEFVQGAAHINGIESFWSFAKSRLHQFAGVPKHTFLLHLKECDFRFNHCYQDLYKVLLKGLRQHPLNSNFAS